MNSQRETSWFISDNDKEIGNRKTNDEVLETKDITSFLNKNSRIPEHIAFILDGNRTYAKQSSTPTIEGHRKGLEKLKNVCHWCEKLGIKELTAYIFSIENFNRPKRQVDELMILARHAFMGLVADLPELQQSGICIRVIGDWTKFPKSIVHIFAKLMWETRGNSEMNLNLAFAYSSRNEIITAVNEIQQGLLTGRVDSSDVTAPFFNEVIRVRSTQRQVDLLIRTSGVKRLSDFMMWQSQFSILYFTGILWPEVTYWDICQSLIFYQEQLRDAKKKNMMEIVSPEKYGRSTLSPNAISFVEHVENKFWKNVQELAEYYF